MKHCLFQSSMRKCSRRQVITTTTTIRSSSLSSSTTTPFIGINATTVRRNQHSSVTITDDGHHPDKLQRSIPPPSTNPTTTNTTAIANRNYHRNNHYNSNHQNHGAKFPPYNSMAATTNTATNRSVGNVDQLHQPIRYTAQQERAFRLERTRRIQSTVRFLSLVDPNEVSHQLQQASFRQEVKSTFQYWTTIHAARWGSRDEDQPTLEIGSSDAAVNGALMQGIRSSIREAQKLLNWMIQYGSPELLQFAIQTEDSKVGALVQMIHTLLIPFRGTQSGFHIMSDHRIRREAKLDSMQESLEAASQIGNTLQHLIDNPIYPGIVQHDGHSCLAMLAMWSKQCWLLSPLAGLRSFNQRDLVKAATIVEQQQQQPSPTTQQLNGSMFGSREQRMTYWIDKMERFIANMKTRDDCGLYDPNPMGSSNNDTMYNALITAMVYSGLPGSLERAREVLMTMNPPASHSCCYNTLAWGYAMHAGEDPTNAIKARDLIGQLEDKSNMTRTTSSQYDDENTLRPDIISYSTVLLAYSNAILPEEAEKYLNEMESKSENLNIFPNTICYNTAMAAWAKSISQNGSTSINKANDHDHRSRRQRRYVNAQVALDKILALLHRMQHLAAAGSPYVRPDRIAYGFVIEAFAKSSKPDGGERAEALLFKTAQDEDASVRPDIVTYNKVVFALAKREHGAERAERILRRMQRQHEWSPQYHPSPDVLTYNACIHAWNQASRSNPEAFSKVLDLLNELEKTYRNGNTELKPNNSTFNSILATVARSNLPDAVEKAEWILTRMDQSGVHREICTYNTFLDVLARFDCKTGVCADRALLILKTMEDEYQAGQSDWLRPNAITYNTVLKAVAKDPRPDAAVRCERLLHRMITLSKSDPQRRGDLRPEPLSFTTVLDAWGRSGREDVLQRIEHILDIMDEYAKPNVYTVNAVLTAISRSKLPDAGPRAEAVFQRLQQSSESGKKNWAANKVTFSTLIACWGRSNLPGAAERAEAYFRKLMELYEDGNFEFRPEQQTYTSLFDAWTKSLSPQKVDHVLSILDELEAKSHTDKNFCKPNVFSYNSVLNCIAKCSHIKDKVDRIKAVLEKQMQVSSDGSNEAAKPNIVTFTIMLNACAFAKTRHSSDETIQDEKSKAFTLAKWVMQEIAERNMRPNAMTYANYILCCKYQLPSSEQNLRNDLATRAFTAACNDGLISQRLLEVFRSTVSEHVYAETMIKVKISPNPFEATATNHRNNNTQNKLQNSELML